MLTTDELLILNPNQIVLDLSLQESQGAWESGRQFSSDVGRWNAYLNRICLNPIISWLQEESGIEPQIFPSPTETINLWESINGVAISLEQTRIVIIPSEAIDTEEFCVPQEWVDIPNWTANYYLAVQVSPDDGYLRVWGYATHQQLKNSGIYDAVDRTYSLERADVIEDLNVMWVARQLCPDEKVEVEVLPILSPNQAETILAQISQYPLDSLRLNLPFPQWGALLSQNSWRQQLWGQREVAVATNPTAVVERTLTNLSNWFENLFETGWQTIADFMGQPDSNLTLAFRSIEMAVNRRETIANLIDLIYNSVDDGQLKVAAQRLGEIGNNNAEAIAALIHLIRTTEDEETRWAAAESLWTIAPNHPASGVRRITDLGMQIGDRNVALMVAILPKAEGKVAILLRVYPMGSQTYLPSGLQLAVLDEDGDIFLETEARDSDNYIQLKFGGDRGERFSVRVALGDSGITEGFAI
jgi:Protein of unknown function (DUF1822)